MSFTFSASLMAGLLTAQGAATDAAAEPVKLPPPAANPFRIGKTAWRDINFVPPRWKLFEKMTGDLNGDGLTDSVLIVQKNDPAKMIENKRSLGMDYYDANPRVVLVLLQKNAGEYHLVAADTGIIPDHDSPTISDPYEDMRIDKGTLHLHIVSFANAGGWSTSNRRFQFRWDGEAMALIGFDGVELKRNTGDIYQLSINYLTGKRKDAEGNIADDDETDWKWSDLPKGTAHALGSIGNAFEFDG